MRVCDAVQNKDQNTVTQIEAQTLSVNAASHVTEEAFTRNEIQPDVPTNNFGPLFGSFIRLTG